MQVATASSLVKTLLRGKVCTAPAATYLVIKKDGRKITLHFLTSGRDTGVVSDW